MLKRGTDSEDKIKERLEIAKAELKQSEVEGFHDQIFVNGDLETTYKALEAYIFGNEEGQADSNAMETDDAAKD